MPQGKRMGQQSGGQGRIGCIQGKFEILGCCQINMKGLMQRDNGMHLQRCKYYSTAQFIIKMSINSNISVEQTRIFILNVFIKFNEKILIRKQFFYQFSLTRMIIIFQLLRKKINSASPSECIALEHELVLLRRYAKNRRPALQLDFSRPNPPLLLPTPPNQLFSTKPASCLHPPNIINNGAPSKPMPPNLKQHITSIP